MSDAIDFNLIQSWEPTGRRVRTIESANVFTERARKLIVRYRRVTEGGVPPPETDSDIAAALSEFAGRTVVDAELVNEIGRYLQFSGWSKEYCFGLACNIAFANLEEPDQFSYLEKP
jgi:hypothetical protein